GGTCRRSGSRAAGLGLVALLTQCSLDLAGRMGDQVDKAPGPLVFTDVRQALAPDRNQPEQLLSVGPQHDVETLDVLEAFGLLGFDLGPIEEINITMFGDFGPRRSDLLRHHANP